MGTKAVGMDYRGQMQLEASPIQSSLLRIDVLFCPRGGVVGHPQ